MNTSDQKKLIENVKKISHEAGKIILRHAQDHFVFEKKSALDLVTSIDQQVNDFLCDKLFSLDQSINIIAEEGVESFMQKKDKQFSFVIDPIDGTTNFFHRVNHSGISIGLYDHDCDQAVAGVVLDPFKNECFSAVKSGGAFLNEQKISCSQVSELQDAIIATGFAYDRAENPDNNLAEFSRVMPKVQGIRRFGAASLDLCYVACGRFDSYFERNLRSWDLCAGAAIVSEAGGMVSDYEKKPIRLNTNHVLASNQLLYKKLLGEISTARKMAGLPTMPN